MAKPEKTFRAGVCSTSVFVNEKTTENGPVNFPSVAFSCRYWDKSENKWKDSSSMSPNEVARAIVVLQKALEHCVLKETEPSAKEVATATPVEGASPESPL